jgi:hypothetical protein
LLLWAAVAAFGATFSASCAGAAAEPTASAKLKVAYHLNDRGGVVRIAELQSQGYLYLRP